MVGCARLPAVCCFLALALALGRTSRGGHRTPIVHFSDNPSEQSRWRGGPITGAGCTGIKCGSQGGSCDPFKNENAGGTPGSKITAPRWVQDRVARSDIRAFGVVESSSMCGAASIVWWQRAPFFVADSLMQDQPDQS